MSNNLKSEFKNEYVNLQAIAAIKESSIGRPTTKTLSQIGVQMNDLYTNQPNNFNHLNMHEKQLIDDVNDTNDF